MTNHHTPTREGGGTAADREGGEEEGEGQRDRERKREVHRQRERERGGGGMERESMRERARVGAPYFPGDNTKRHWTRVISRSAEPMPL